MNPYSFFLKRNRIQKALLIQYIMITYLRLSFAYHSITYIPVLFYFYRLKIHSSLIQLVRLKHSI